MKLEYAIAQKSGASAGGASDHVSVLLGGDILQAGSDLNTPTETCKKSGVLFSLCDGGSGNGKTLECAESCNSELSALLSSETDIASYNELDAKSKLAEGLKRANELLLQLSETEEGGAEMHSSIGALWLCNDFAIFSHVGNVRIYRYSDGVLELLTDDHTEAWQLVEEGKITPEKVVNYPGNKILTQVLGGKGKKHADIVIDMKRVESGDCFMLCSDGVSHYLADRVLEDLFLQKCDGGDGMQGNDLATCIVAQAFERSEGKETATAIVLQVFPKTSRWSEMIRDLENDDVIR